MQKRPIYPFLLGAAVIAVLLVAAGAPLASLVPFALLLACPAAMIMVMRRLSATGSPADRPVLDGGDGDRDGDGDGTSPGERPTSP